MGQSICSRLMKGQKKISKNIRNIISKYNKWQSVPSDGILPEKLQWNDVIESSCKCQNSSAFQKFINIKQMISRGKEEVGLVKTEMRNALNFYQDQVDCINNLLLRCPNSYAAYVRTCAFQIETSLRYLHNTLKTYVPDFVPQLPVLAELERKELHYSYALTFADDFSEYDNCSNFSEDDCSSIESDNADDT